MLICWFFLRFIYDVVENDNVEMVCLFIVYGVDLILVIYGGLLFEKIVYSDKMRLFIIGNVVKGVY